MGNNIKTGLAAAMAFLLSKLGILAPWVPVLLFVMTVDYLTGIACGFSERSLSSRAGLLGIIKKLSYGILVAVAMVTDWVLAQLGGYVGLGEAVQGFVGLLVMLWLIVNEIISILENLGRLGVAYPKWLLGLMHHLKQSAEQKGEGMSK